MTGPGFPLSSSRPGADPDVEGVHDNPRPAGVCPLREGAHARQVGHGREPHLQAGHLHLQEPHLRRQIVALKKKPAKTVPLQPAHYPPKTLPKKAPPPFQLLY